MLCCSWELFLWQRIPRICSSRTTTLAARNDVLQAEIDSLKEQINDATSIEKVETIATKKYGMVQPDESNYITIRDEKKQGSSLATR